MYQLVCIPWLGGISHIQGAALLCVVVTPSSSIKGELSLTHSDSQSYNPTSNNIVSVSSRVVEKMATQILPCNPVVGSGRPGYFANPHHCSNIHTFPSAHYQVPLGKLAQQFSAKDDSSINSSRRPNIYASLGNNSSLQNKFQVSKSDFGFYFNFIVNFLVRCSI